MNKLLPKGITAWSKLPKPEKKPKGDKRKGRADENAKDNAHQPAKKQRVA